MPVDSTHPRYAKYIKKWERCRRVVEGEDAVKAAKTESLKQLEGQSTEEYEDYLGRAMLYDAGERTVSGLTGAVIRKRPLVEFPGADDDDVDDVTKDGAPLSVFVEEVLAENIAIGRGGLLVDAEEDSETPYVAMYPAESIVNWRLIDIDGQSEIELLVLAEDVESSDDEDEFVVEIERKYRVLRLVPTSRIITEEGEQQFPDDALERPYTYVQELWKKRETQDGAGEVGDEWEIESSFIPRRVGGLPFSRIPFVAFNPTTLSVAKIESPPILAMCNVILSHFANSADLEHGLHFTALPTAWVAGFDPKQNTLKIGSTTAWVTEKPDASAGFMEFSGSGLASIEARMSAKQKLAATLGARLLEEQSAEAEAAKTVAMRHRGEESVLSKVAKTTGRAVEQVLKFLADWRGDDPENVSFEFKIDVTVRNVSSDVLARLMEMLHNGDISYDVFYYNLEMAEVYPEGWNIQTEKAKIAAGTPSGTTPPDMVEEDDEFDESDSDVDDPDDDEEIDDE